MVKAVVGANWGDEGKGKITDMLGKESDIIVRFQGGANGLLRYLRLQPECIPSESHRRLLCSRICMSPHR